MKTMTLLTYAISILSVSAFAGKPSARVTQDGKDIIAIDLDDGSRYSKNKRFQEIDQLNDRIWRLERAVRQLQDEVFRLQDTRNEGKISKGKWACSLTGSFNGTHIGKGDTRIEAEASAKKLCEASEKSSVYCADSNVKCERDN